MAGNPAFQGSPKAWVVNAFQSGVSLVAGAYSTGSPIFATPGPLAFKYAFSSPAYALGSPAFARPTVTTFPPGALKQVHANPYSLGALAWPSPSILQKRAFTANAFTLGSPVFATPAAPRIGYRLFANASAIGSPVFATPPLLFNYKLKQASYSLGPLAWSPVGPFFIKNAFKVNAYWLGSPRFAAPRLQTQIVSLGLPPTYFTQIEEATNVLVGMLNRLMSSIPPGQTTARDALRIMVSVLRNNAGAAVRGNTLGTQLQAVFLAADAAGATFPGVESCRQYLMSYAGSFSVATQIVFRAGLVMTLGLECKIISRLTFKTRDDVQQLMIQLRAAFEESKALGIDEVDALVYQTLNAMGGAIMNHLAQQALQAPRFVSWQSKAPLPSLYLANRIYADASRSDQIEAENDVVHPAFCPTRLRVLSYPPVGPG
jgi:hypothetical protein